jgi:hypothetical protein
MTIMEGFALVLPDTDDQEVVDYLKKICCPMHIVDLGDGDGPAFYLDEYRLKMFVAEFGVEPANE